SSYAYPAEAKDIVKKYPRISFVTNSAEHHARNMTSFFVRMYQVRYLAGAIAGMKTKTGIIGYVAAMPNSAVQRNINAFALGVQRVNPQAKVLVTWTGSWQDEPKEAENARKLVAAGADVLTYHQDEKTVADTARELGVDFIGDHERIEDDSPHNLTSTVCRWEIYYTNILQNYLKGELNAVNNHWLGIGQRTIYLSKYGDAVNEDMQKQTDRLKQELLEGYPIFTGEIYDNQGNLRCAEDETIKDDALLKHINWLVKGVEILE
ncbi:MAG: BMP family ABC transporter substrate-binding protein, partial [Selenomonadaceae bacterium]|nr:BMP family ABC transporter substrate-binding protein [Selenomonadaceae bacterium]